MDANLQDFLRDELVIVIIFLARKYLDEQIMYQVFLLLYSTDAESFFPKQLLQLDHLVRYVRKHATEFSVNLNKIIVTGFQPVFNYLLCMADKA